MNLIHRRYCRSGRWRRHLDRLLPWATEGVPLAGSRVLELGSGPRRTTDWLTPRCGALTAVELDPADAAALAARLPVVEVHRADATDLPFAAGSFDVVVAFTMLHHVPTIDLQNQLLTEARRVLRPGGVLAGSDSRWGPLFALAHLGDTMRLIDPAGLPARLAAAGFGHASVRTRPDAFAFQATA
ncbi:MAG: class I SAM-dependent methyltransferase [Kineosporiaceae bacterium]